MKCPIEVTKDHVVYDRSRVVTDWNCPRQRFWNYEFDSTGIAPESMAMELYTGITMHDALSAIAHLQQANGTVDVDLVATTAYGQMFKALAPKGEREDEGLINYAKEQASLMEGMIRGFCKHVWPKLMDTHDIVSIEEELFYVHNDEGESDLTGLFVFMSKPDLILRNKVSGELVYIEYKTTGTKSAEWINSWDDAVQIHSTILAVEQSLGERPTSIIVQGIYKGYVSYGKQSSPFCYAYHRNAQPPFIKAETTYEYKNGLKRIPTWELEGGLKGWIAGMPETILAEQFPQTPPIFPNDVLAIDFFAQRAAREAEIAAAKDNLDKTTMNKVFEQKFDRCKPAYGAKIKPCAYRLLCHGTCKDPLTSGYTKRIPHHELETEQHENKTASQQHSTDEHQAGQTQTGGNSNGDAPPA